MYAGFQFFQTNKFFFTYLDCDKVDRAFSLALAALLGSDVFNFGELVLQLMYNVHVHVLSALVLFILYVLLQFSLHIPSWRV